MSRMTVYNLDESSNPMTDAEKREARRDPSQRLESKKIGERLKWAREALDLSRVQLADEVGVDWTMIRHIENGTRVPSIFLALALIHVLDISPQYLLWGVLEGVEPTLHTKLAALHPELRHASSTTLPTRPAHGNMRSARSRRAANQRSA